MKKGISVLQTIKSTYEPSTNFLFNYGKGVIEARYVRKDVRPYVRPYVHKILNNVVKAPTPGTRGHFDVIPKKSYIACYVSSHNGCSMGCQMCFLTHNRDTSMKHVDIETYLLQIETVLEHYRKVTSVPSDLSADQDTPEKEREPLADRCNINFMSKGDALANKYLLLQYPVLYEGMDRLCRRYGLYVKPNISTIMPLTVRDRALYDIFQDYPAYLYYSLYSIDPAFRERWLPNALPYLDALDKLKIFQETRKDRPIITFHWSLIKGQNDQIDEAKKMAKILKSYDFDAKLNIVRFNPHPNVSDQEADPSTIEEIFQILSDVFENDQSYIVPRLDVKTKTPCGMFVPVLTR